MLLNLQDYTICDSWNTYHVIKTVQVDPFVSNLHFELPDGDNCLFTIRERRGRGSGVKKERERGEGRGRWLRMIEIVFNAGGVFCMATVGQGG